MRQNEENKSFTGRTDSEDKRKEAVVGRECIDQDMGLKLVKGKKEGNQAEQR